MSFAIKPGADIRGLQLPMHKVLVVVTNIYQRHGYETVVTSGLDGTHSAGSWHYYGYALDFRTNHVDKVKLPAMIEETKRSLGSDYFVLFEGDHLHVDARGYIARTFGREA
jgi:hypothetical protein